MHQAIPHPPGEGHVVSRLEVQAISGWASACLWAFSPKNQCQLLTVSVRFSSERIHDFPVTKNGSWFPNLSGTATEVPKYVCLLNVCLKF